MSTPESDGQIEFLRSIATSLKAIHTSLDQLTAAVEGVAESIETAHEPEGDLGHHLVGALKDISSALHKRAQQERTPQPQQRQNHPQSQRRDDRPQLRPHFHPQQDRQQHSESPDEQLPDQADFQGECGPDATPDFASGNDPKTPQKPDPQLQGPRPKKPRPHRHRENRKTSPQTAPDNIPAPSPAED